MLCLDILFHFSNSDTCISQPLFDRGHIPKLLDVMQWSEFEALRCTCITILRNLCADCAQFRDQVLQYDAVQIIAKMQHKPLPLVVEFVWMLYNVMMVEPPISRYSTLLLIEPVTQILVGQQLNNSDSQCLCALVRTLKTIFRRHQGDQSIYEYFTAELSWTLLALLKSTTPAIKIDVVDILSMVSFASKDKYDLELQAAIVCTIADTLMHSAPPLREKCLQSSFMALSNYVVDGHTIIDHVMHMRDYLMVMDVCTLKQRSRVSVALFYRNLALSCSEVQFLALFHHHHEYKLFKDVMVLLEDGASTDLVIACLQTLLAMFSNFQRVDMMDTPINQLAVYGVFEDEGGLQMLHNYQSHASDIVFQEVEKLQDLIDIN